MHADLGRVDGGWMHDKLTDLAGALAAFGTDLGSGLDQVTLVTMSEFGRRVEENESAGVDHGWGNCMFVLGGHVVTDVHGDWPTLAPDRLTDGDLTVTTDYRAVLADVLTNRTGASVERSVGVPGVQRRQSGDHDAVIRWRGQFRGSLLTSPTPAVWRGALGAATSCRVPSG